MEFLKSKMIGIIFICHETYSLLVLCRLRSLTALNMVCSLNSFFLGLFTITFQLGYVIQFFFFPLLVTLYIINVCKITHPEEWVKGTILHELCNYHDWAALCDDTLQADNVWVVKLTHDWRFRQEVPPLLLHVACLQGFDGYVYLSLTRQLQTALIHLPKFTLKGNRERDTFFRNNNDLYLYDHN